MAIYYDYMYIYILAYKLYAVCTFFLIVRLVFAISLLTPSVMTYFYSFIIRK